MSGDGIVNPGLWFRNDHSLKDASFRKGYGNPEIFKHRGKFFHGGLPETEFVSLINRYCNEYAGC
jgi:hypothetical protein